VKAALAPAALAALVTAAASLGCGDTFEDRDLSRMIVQERYATWQACGLFADGSVMRPPPEGVVARESAVGDERVLTGMDGGAYAARVPVPLSAGFVRHGRERFDIFCAPCHGASGDGESFVAHRMDLRRPPSLVGDGARRLPPGRIFQTVSFGYGLMPSYSRALSIDDRWAVVAYVLALQVRARGARLDDLPPPARHTAEEQLR
jgi:hypothetical protein